MALTKETTNLFADLCIGIASFASPAFASIAPVVAPLTAFASMGLHLKDGSAKLANKKAQKAVIKALKGHAEFSDTTLKRAQSLLKDADSTLSLSSETLLAAAKSGAFEVEVVRHLLAPLTLDLGESSVLHILETALLAGLRACRKDDTFHQALTQELLIDAAHLADMQLELLTEIKDDTAKIEAQNIETHDLLKQLIAGKMPEGLTLEQLHALATQFKVVVNEGDTPSTILQNLTLRAEEIEALEQMLPKLLSQHPQLSNAIAEASTKLAQGDTNAVRNLVRDARMELRDVKLLEALLQDAYLVEIDARALLIEGDVKEAFTVLSAAADSLGSVDTQAPNKYRVIYADYLYKNGLNFGGDGLTYAAYMLETALKSISREKTPEFWAYTHNFLAMNLAAQAKRTDGKMGVALVNLAISSYKKALAVRTRTCHPLDWAVTKSNLANALRLKAQRLESTKAIELLEETLKDLYDVLSVYTVTLHPLDWARTQNSLASVFGNLALQYTDTTGAEYAELAIKAYRKALIIITKTKHPADWAMIKNNLGSSLKDQAIRIGGPKAKALRDEALDSLFGALTFYTKKEHPINWASTKANIAIVELNNFQLSNKHNSRSHLEAALAHVDGALTIFSPIHMAYDYGTATRLRDDILKALSD